jgi:hypothetical protein
MIAGSICAVALAEVPPRAVVENLGHDVRVNWTTLSLEVEGVAWGTGAQTWQTVEQLARRKIDAAVRQAVGSVPVTGGARVADLVADEVLGEAIASRIPRWEVTEATYGTSGRVALHATLSLQDLLKPWTLQIASAADPSPIDPSLPTGLVVDARGLGADPAYAPRLVDIEGRPLYAGELRQDRAVQWAPYVYVTDPSHPAAAAAGANPLTVRATDSRRSDLVIGTPVDASRILEIAGTVLSRGAVVVVTDPMD